MALPRVMFRSSSPPVGRTVDAVAITSRFGEADAFGFQRLYDASDDPRYAALRNRPARDPRVPVVAPPVELTSGY